MQMVGLLGSCLVPSLYSRRKVELLVLLSNSFFKFVSTIYFSVLSDRQPKRRLSESKKQASFEEKPSLHDRQISAGTEYHPVPRPPSASHDRHPHGIVPNRTLASKSVEGNVFPRGKFSPSPPTSANQSRITPSPPSSAKAGRANSATRFRKMVVECRDSAR